MGNARLDVARGPRFIFYANEVIGLGQLRRTLALAARLSDSECAPELVDSHGVGDRADLSAPSAGRRGEAARSQPRSGRQAVFGRLELNADELLSLRSIIALASATSFRPDVAVVDKLPLGHRCRSPGLLRGS